MSYLTGCFHTLKILSKPSHSHPCVSRGIVLVDNLVIDTCNYTVALLSFVIPLSFDSLVIDYNYIVALLSFIIPLSSFLSHCQIIMENRHTQTAGCDTLVVVVLYLIFCDGYRSEKSESEESEEISESQSDTSSEGTDLYYNSNMCCRSCWTGIKQLKTVIILKVECR